MLIDGILLTQEAVAVSNVASLALDGKVTRSQLPDIAITDTFVAASQVEMLALTAEVGDVAVRTDLGKTFILKVEGASALENWQELLHPNYTLPTATDAIVGGVRVGSGLSVDVDGILSAIGSVTSVAGRTGAITLAAADVSGLSAVATSGSYTDLSNKPSLFDLSTTLLNLRFNGSNGVTASIDECGNALTFGGDANLSIIQKKFGTTSLRLNGTGYVSFPVAAYPVTSATSTFTIECWVYPTSNGNEMSIIGGDQAGQSSISSCVQIHNGVLRYAYISGNTSKVAISGGTVTLNQWSHIAVVSIAGAITLYINGVSTGSGTMNGLYWGATAAYICNLGWGISGYVNKFVGYIDDLRLSNVARYTANFTPSTTELAGLIPASQLNSSYTIGMTGDVSWTSPAFNGTSSVTASATLANSGVVAGTYPKVTVDAKGRVTAGAALLSADVTTALGFTPVNATVVGANSGVATLDSGGKLSSSQIPAIAITDTFVVASQVAMLALVAEVGDVAVRTDLNKSFILKTAGASVLANWQELLTPTDSVSSVFGRTGSVTLQSGDVSTALGFTPAPAYTLPAATTLVLGGVKQGTNISIAGDGTISATAAPYTLPAATISVLGGVKQGTNVTIAGDGTISATAAPYTLPVATGSVLGGVKQGSGVTIDVDGTISAASSYTLPIATASVLGGVKQGANITIAGDGTISASASGSFNPTTTTSCYIPFSGTDGSTTYTDTIGQTLIPSGSGSIKVDLYAGGAYSDNSGAGSIAVQSHQSLIMGSEDFTIEFWASTSGGSDLWRKDVVSGPGWSIAASQPAQSITGWYYWRAATDSQFQGFLKTSVAPTTTFQHIALVRTDGIVTMYVDGIGYGAGSVPDFEAGATGNITIGSGNWYGQIRNLKISKGVGLYRENFTPKTTLPLTSSYTLPKATSTKLGGIKPGTTLAVDGNGVLNYTLPKATASVLGGVKQGTTITVDANGVIELPIASNSGLGGIKTNGTTLVVDGTGVLNTVLPFVSKYNIIGTLSAVSGSTRWYPERNITITGVYFSLGVTGACVINLRKNGTLITPTSPATTAGQYKSTVQTLNVAATPSDYISVDVVSATDAADAVVFISYN